MKGEEEGPGKPTPRWVNGLAGLLSAIIVFGLGLAFVVTIGTLVVKSLIWLGSL